MKVQVRKVLGLVGASVFGLVAFAQETDTLFPVAAAQSDLYEITSSELALERAASEAVRTYAQTMINHHTMTTEQLTPIAEELGLTPPTETTAAAQLDIAYLETLEGAAFDTAYMEQQQVSHEAAVAAFEIASETAQNEDLRAFATENLPIIEEHLTMVQEMTE